MKVDTAHQKVLGYLNIGGMPQDIKVDPAGKVWYVSDIDQDGVHLIDGDSFKQIGFIPTGPEAHGLYPSRNAHVLYVSNRGGVHDQGSVSVIDFATRKVIANWPIPAPSTPDMGGVSPDGKTLWLSGRRNNEVYGIDTTTGAFGRAHSSRHRTARSRRLAAAGPLLARSYGDSSLELACDRQPVGERKHDGRKARIVRQRRVEFDHDERALIGRRIRGQHMSVAQRVVEQEQAARPQPGTGGSTYPG